MSLTQHDLEQIAKVFDTTWQKKHQEFWIEAEAHYLDHQQLAECRQTKDEWIKNHHFISEFRAATEQVKRVTLRTAVTLIVTAIVGYVLYAIGFKN